MNTSVDIYQRIYEFNIGFFLIFISPFSFQEVMPKNAHIAKYIQFTIAAYMTIKNIDLILKIVITYDWSTNDAVKCNNDASYRYCG